MANPCPSSCLHPTSPCGEEGSILTSVGSPSSSIAAVTYAESESSSETPPCKGTGGHGSGRAVTPTQGHPHCPEHTLGPQPSLPHLKGVVEEFAHSAEAAALPLALLQPAQRVRDVPLLDGHVGSGLPEGLEDKRCQPGARETPES